MSDAKPEAWHRRDRSRDLTGLGWLEADVLRVVWDKGEVTVRDVYESLRENRRIAYTTVMSVLRNLAVKGLLEQDKLGKRKYAVQRSYGCNRWAKSLYFLAM